MVDGEREKEWLYVSLCCVQPTEIIFKNDQVKLNLKQTNKTAALINLKSFIKNMPFALIQRLYFTKFLDKKPCVLPHFSGQKNLYIQIKSHSGRPECTKYARKVLQNLKKWHLRLESLIGS